MKRLVMFAAVVSLAACAKKDEAPVVDTTAAAMAAPAPTMAMPDSAMKADSIRADSIKKADSMKAAEPAKH